MKRDKEESQPYKEPDGPSDEAIYVVCGSCGHDQWVDPQNPPFGDAAQLGFCVMCTERLDMSEGASPFYNVDE